jgi:hypothetical protein
LNVGFGFIEYFFEVAPENRTSNYEIKSGAWKRSINLQPTIEMKAKRRKHDSAFKARLAIEAEKEEKTIHEIAKDNEVYSTQVT